MAEGQHQLVEHEKGSSGRMVGWGCIGCRWQIAAPVSRLEAAKLHDVAVGKTEHEHEGWMLEGSYAGKVCQACGVLVEPNWPEHAKLEALNGENEVVGRFIEWLNEQNIVLATEMEGSTRVEFKSTGPDGAVREESDRVDVAYWPVNKTTETWLSEYFGIDQRKLSLEKDDMLRKMMEGQG